MALTAAPRQSVVSRTISAPLAGKLHTGAAMPVRVAQMLPDSRGSLDDLTARELEALSLTAQGLPNTAIAKSVVVSKAPWRTASPTSSPNCWPAGGGSVQL
ncbi:hypothetical protein [Amycolatopsis sp. FDAARGOS 1241]|uniref:hypothetical protein n=1 Tax=Amycolatopsis sp. FDAARGOS 1241 TaxID=2778070 RepID=UPI001950375B|nr:hypothetical protein I6J71_07145 [Amycolatopsis sp. FDAARGOS 1241]